jgi:hypothetical protein
LVDAIFEELVSDKYFIETCDFLGSHAIRLDQEYKKKLQDRFTMLANYPIDPNKYKVKKFISQINEVKIQDSCSSDEESVAVPPTKTAMVCKLAQIPPEIWMTLPLEAKKWLLNQRKRQQQKDDK